LLFHFCAKVNQDAYEPLKILRDSPMRNYGIDFQRLTEQVEDRDVGINGMKFFVITKGFMISVS